MFAKTVPIMFKFNIFFVSDCKLLGLLKDCLYCSEGESFM